MNRHARVGLVFAVVLATFLLNAQQAKPGLLNSEELKKALPATYFFGGQSAPVQLRNSAGFRTPQGQLVLAGLVVTSGYASDMAAKYQGLLISETKLQIEGSDLVPGAYGFGFTKEGKFLVMDVGTHDVLSVASKPDENLKHPVPLKITAEEGGYRLYAGKQWVSLKTE